MINYPKRTIDLEVGDVVAMYGARERVTAIRRVDREARYTAVSARMESITRPGYSHEVCFDNVWVRVELPAGMKLVAVPIDAPRHGEHIAVDLDEINALMREDWSRRHHGEAPASFGWGVCRHGYGLQQLDRMTEAEAREKAAELNAAI